MQKIQKVIVSNFKGIKEAEFNLDGKSIFVIGKNHTGKSSLVDGIFKNLETSVSEKGKVTLAKIDQPLNKDATEGFVETHISNDNGEYIVKNIFTEDGKRKLEITSPDGFKTSAVASLEKLVGAIDFNIGEFVDLGKSVPGRREQVELIKQFIADEVLDQMDKLDIAIANHRETRQFLNKDIRDLKVLVNKSPLTQKDIATYTEQKDGLELNRKYQEATNHNAGKVALESEFKTANELLVKDEQTLSDYKESSEKVIAKLKRELKAKEKEASGIIKRGTQKVADQVEAIDKIQDQIDKFVEKNTEAISGEIATITEYNNKVTEVATLLTNRANLQDKEDEYKDREKEMGHLESEKKQLVAESELPIAGLTFNDDGLYLDGVQISGLSTSEQIEKIGIPLSIAKDPNVKIIRVAYGESCDFDTLTRISESAESKGYQLIVEEVQREADEMRVEFSEDYLK